MKVLSRIILLMGSVFVLSLMMGCATQIPAGYMGVVTKWGKVHKTVGEGLCWYEPISRNVVPINCQIQKWEQRCEAASYDLQTVSTMVALNYNLDPTKAGDFYSKYGYAQITYQDQSTWVYTQKLIVPRINEVVKKVTAKYKAPELVTQRGAVKDEIENELVTSLAPFGIMVANGGVSLTDFSFSEAYDAAIEDKQVAEQLRDKARYDLERASIEADTEVAEAKGHAEAAQLMTQSLSPQVLQQDWIEKWDGHLPQVAGSDSIIFMPQNMSTGP